ncbi:MAG TPA: protein kinase [Thermoanaerobaculia bacterium]|nr:protein kinase [Thermoanaerobaculia bacterium]
MTLAAGSKLGPYEIVGQIGAGGMGEVYRARDPRLGRDVAIKVLPASFSSDPDRLKRFEQEAKAAGILSHPNITVVYDVGSHDGAPYVVQELLEGETLRSELAGGRFASRKAIDYAIQIAQGLAAAHDKGIVHRDLKPENLFVTKDGRVKILDFGLAKLTHAEGSGSTSRLPTATEPGIVMGTLGYMSPEQIKGEAADGRSDIFALGAILYEMLSGRRAFEGGSTGEAMAAILKEDPPDLSVSNKNVSPGLERLVRHCLEKNRERRFQSARDLAYDLETLTTASGAAPSSALPTPRRRWRVPLAAAALLALGVLAGWGLLRLRKEQPVSYTRITFRRGTVYSARFAPDGQTIVYCAAWEGQPARIFVTRPGSTESRDLQLPDARILAVSATRELAILIVRQSIWIPTGTLARVPLEGGAPREVLENVSLADWSPDGRELAVVHRVGAKDRVEFPIGKVLYETGDRIGSLRFSPRGDRIAVTDYGGTITILNLAGKVTTLNPGRGWSAAVWRPDGREIWLGGYRIGEKFVLYAMTPDGRERLVRREAAGLFLHDISSDGRVLLNEYVWTSSLAALPPGEVAERDLSWMDFSMVSDIPNDGRFVVFNEAMEGGGKTGAVYLRAMDRSPAVRLGEGFGLAVSPDGRWVMSGQAWGFAPDAHLLLPTGPGQKKPLEHKGVAGTWARFFPDGKRVLFLGETPKGVQRLWVQDLDGGAPRPISPEGMRTAPFAISPDGRFVAAQGPDGNVAIYPIDGGASRPLLGATAGESPVRWSADGRTIYVFTAELAPSQVFRIDVATGERQPWKTLAPADRTGLVQIDTPVLTPDARSYAYSYQRILTELEIAEGLK